MRYFVSFVLLAVFIILFYWISPIKPVYTLDRSLPHKWWIWLEMGHFEKFDYVEFVPPVENHYTKGKLLVKQVACVEGETLQVIGLDYYCNGKYLARARTKDSKGRVVEPFVYNGLVPKDCFFALGEAENSYDSRYFGFVCKEHVRAKLVPLLKGPDIDKLFLGFVQ